MTMETITISRIEYEELRRKQHIADQLRDYDLDFVSQVLSSKEDLKAGRIKRLA